MAYDKNNVFARILRGELPCHRIYEDADSLAFLDIMPQSEGHALVLPKEGAEFLPELSIEGMQGAMRTVHMLMPVIQRITGADGVMLAQFNGAAAGQTVPHVHFHIIPRYAGQQMKLHARDQADPAALSALAEKIKAALAAA